MPCYHEHRNAFLAFYKIFITFQLTLDCDKTIDPALFDDSPEGVDSGAIRDGTLGSGVILLAQQLILNQGKSKQSNKSIG